MPAPEIDVLIHGAGPVGCTLALALRGTGLRVAVFDRTSFASSFRPIALSYASRLILERVGAWQAATPIETIHVSQAGGFGHARLEAGDAAVPALGYVMDYSTLAGSLRSQVEEFITKDAVAAKCAVHAEGAAPDTEEKRYAQDAVVALVHTDPPAQSAAFERFTPRRRLDAAATIRVTDFLAGAFLGSNRFARGARGAALAALDAFPPARRFFARRMIYGPSALP